MSVKIYPLDNDRVLARLGLRMQLEALAPFPAPREHGAPWGLTRLPFTPFLPPFYYPPAEFEPGEELPGEGTPGAGGAGGAPSSRVSSSSQEQCWDYDTISFHIASNINADAHAVASTGAIPAPWRVEYLEMFLHNETQAAGLQLRVMLLDNPFNAENAQPTGEDLIQQVHLGSTAGTPTIAKFPGMQIPTAAVATPRNNYVHHIGRLIPDANKCLAVAIYNTTAGVLAFDGIVTLTIRRCRPVGTSYPEPRSTSARPPVASAPAPRPSTSAPREGSTGMLGESSQAYTQQQAQYAATQGYPIAPAFVGKPPASAPASKSLSW